jgi:hypothetical protein
LSADLLQWSSSPANLEEISVQSDPNGITEQVQVRVKPAISEQTGNFVRLRVTPL